MPRAVVALGSAARFRGYGPDQGYDFLREAIVEHDYKALGVDVSVDEIFVSDGSKCDSGNIQEIFASDATLAVTDPVYPVYVDTNVMAGRTGAADDAGTYAGVLYLPCTEANGFNPELPSRPVDIVYLCYPNNPTGTCADRATLKRWVDWARENSAVILFDGAYEAYISDPEIPHSIFEIPGAREVAIEFRSYSKMAGFTGVRCGYVVVPRELVGRSASGENVELHSLWARRQATKFNGASYPVQVGASACYSDQGKKELRANIDYYMRNAQLIRKGMEAIGLTVYGAENAPYAWIKTPEGQGSWDLFDRLLNDAHVVGTPGAGFGASGEGFLRLSAFGKRDQVEEAIERIKQNLGG